MSDQTQFPMTLKLQRHERDPIQTRWWLVESEYVESYWLPRLGPSAYVLLRRLDRLVPRDSWQSVAVASLYLAQCVGLGGKLGPNASLARTIERLERFDAVKRRDELLLVRTELPTLPPREVCNLPSTLRRLHRTVEANRSTYAAP